MERLVPVDLGVAGASIRPLSMTIQFNKFPLHGEEKRWRSWTMMTNFYMAILLVRNVFYFMYIIQNLLNDLE